MIWLFRIAKNHQALGRRLTWAPGWAIGGWFLPPIAVRHPDADAARVVEGRRPRRAAGRRAWKSSSDSPLLWIVGRRSTSSPRSCSSSSGCASSSAMMSSDAEDIADSLDDRLGLLIAQSVVVRAGHGGVGPARPGAHRPPRRAHRRSSRDDADADVSIFVVRHAKAGEPAGLGRRRPAAAAVQGRAAPGRRCSPSACADEPVHRAVVEPVRALHRDAGAARPPARPAGRRRAALGRGRPFETTLALLAEVGDGAVLCSHGDVIPDLIEALVRRGTELRTPPDWRKASIWVLDAPTPTDVATAAPSLRRAMR